MKTLMTVAAVCAVFVSTSVYADFDPAATTTLTMQLSDGNYRSSFTNAASWKAATGSGVTPVAPQLMTQNTPPNPDAAGFDYYVPANYYLRTLKGYTATTTYIPFGGRSLHIAGIFQAGNDYAKYPIGGIDLHYREGSKTSLNATLGITNSQITVETTQEKPFWITQAQSTSAMTYVNYDCSLTGASTAWIKMAGETATKGPVNWYYRGNGSAYQGTIEMDAAKGFGHALTLTLGKNTTLENATVLVASNATVMAEDIAGSVVKLGTVTLTSNGTVGSTTKTTIQIGTLNMSGGEIAYGSDKLQVSTLNITGGTLSLAAKASVTLGNVSSASAPLRFSFGYDKTAHTNGQLFVTGTFTGPATIALDANFVSDCFNVPAEQILIRIAKEGNAKPEASAFTIQKPTQPYGILPRASIRVDEGETTWDVVLVASPVVKLLKNVSQGANWSTDAAKAAEYWSDGQVTSADKDYYVANTFYTCSSPSSSRCEFNMHSITIAGASTWINHKTSVFPEVTQLLGGEFTSSSNMDMVFTNGYFYAPSWVANTQLRPYGGYQTATGSSPGARFVFWAPFVGDGQIKILNRGSATPWSGQPSVNFGGSAVKLMVDSPQYTGTWSLLPYAKGARYPYTYLESTRFGINSNLAMGGSPATFTYNALSLSYYACLEPLKTMTLDVANRGIYIDWTARVNVEADREFTVKEPLTFAGTWEKIGTGKLWLGASEAPRFLSTRQELPPSAAGADGTNVLAVTEGSLGVTSTNAVDGLAVQFGANGALAVDSNVAEGDVKTLGLYNFNGFVTKAGDELTVAYTTPVAFSEARTLGVMTIPDAQAAAFLDGDKPKLKGAPKGYRAKYEASSKDGLTTFTVTLERNGSILFLK